MPSIPALKRINLTFWILRLERRVVVLVGVSKGTHRTSTSLGKSATPLFSLRGDVPCHRSSSIWWAKSIVVQHHGFAVEPLAQGSFHEPCPTARWCMWQLSFNLVIPVGHKEDPNFRSPWEARTHSQDLLSDGLCLKVVLLSKWRAIAPLTMNEHDLMEPIHLYLNRLVNWAVPFEQWRTRRHPWFSQRYWARTLRLKQCMIWIAAGQHDFLQMICGCIGLVDPIPRLLHATRRWWNRSWIKQIKPIVRIPRTQAQSCKAHENDEISTLAEAWCKDCRLWFVQMSEEGWRAGRRRGDLGNVWNLEVRKVYLERTEDSEHMINVFQCLASWRFIRSMSSTKWWYDSFSLQSLDTPGMTACGTLDYLAPEAFCSSTSRQAIQNQLIDVDSVDRMMLPFARIAVDFFCWCRDPT